ncbi:putative cell surface protein [Blattamonas nauphoetae]|uniref:Cell surface protein n=1 Tax=Blattamonas nauphoetae TaxID=2049346 RepID=A0ABQ9XEV1_9EUKA|nr:putative cell surface protein [Blattamonas nauphoetae]
MRRLVCYFSFNHCSHFLLAYAAVVAEGANSTLWMISWCLDVQQAGCSACVISSSELRIEGSKIISNMECSPFIVRGDMDGHGSRVQIIQSTHKSASNLVLPLVGTSQHAHRIDLGTQMMNGGTTGNSSFEHLSINGVGLSINNQHFPLGTGPLFTFHSQRVFDCAMEVETDLLESTLLNISSSSAFSPMKQLFRSEVSQRVVGSCVSCCTNHDSGTGMMSPNMGGSLTCLNTSFSSCIRQGNEAKYFQNKNFTQTSDPGRFMLVNTSAVTSVSFTLCTFSEMTATVAGSNFGGPALDLFQTSSSLTLNTCFFHRCICTGGVGGAVHFRCSKNNPLPFSTSDSAFSECSLDESGSMGGNMWVDDASTISISSCFFEMATAYHSGALHFDSQRLTLSNCAFIECSSYASGGALFFVCRSTPSLTFSQFRGCSCTTESSGRDVYLTGAYSYTITSAMFQHCDSTSGTPNVYIYADKKSDSKLIPQVSPTRTFKSVSVSFKGSEAMVTVEVDQAIKGTMGVLLDGSNVPRLVHVMFGDDTTSSNLGKIVVSSGPNGILPRADYAFCNAAVTGYRIITSIGPFINKAFSTLDGWNMTEIVVKGMNLEEGSYSMLIAKEGLKRNITLTRSNSPVLMNDSLTFYIPPSWYVPPEEPEDPEPEEPIEPKPDPEDPKPDPEDPKPDPEDPKPDPEVPKPDPEDPKPDPEDPEPEEPIEPKPDPEDPKPDPEVPKPDPEDPKPDPEDPKPDPEDPKPDPEDPKPEPDEKKTMSAEMKKLLSWMIPLLASLLVALVVVIVFAVLIVHFHRRWNRVKFQPMDKDMDDLKAWDPPPVEELPVDTVIDNIIS